LQYSDCQALAPSPYKEPHDLEADGIAEFGKAASSGIDVHAFDIVHPRGISTIKLVLWSAWLDPVSRSDHKTRTTDSITGTSTSAPTTVASAAPDWEPNSAIAAATASSKKFDAPISADFRPTRLSGAPFRSESLFGKASQKRSYSIFKPEKSAQATKRRDIPSRKLFTKLRLRIWDHFTSFDGHREPLLLLDPANHRRRAIEYQ